MWNLIVLVRDHCLLFTLNASAPYSLFALMCRKTHITHTLTTLDASCLA